MIPIQNTKGNDLPITWNDEDLEAFFGATPFPKTFDSDERQICAIHYNGASLKYMLMLHLSDEIALISGDVENPFGADSMYEIQVPCDSITRIDDGYYPGQVGLGFWYGDTGMKHNMTMMLLKRPDGDLKVWPACVWPNRHKYHTMLAGEYSGDQYDPPTK